MSLILNSFVTLILTIALLFSVFGESAEVFHKIGDNKKKNKNPSVVATSPRLGSPLRNDTLTISGISAGAAMSIQYGIAFSSQVNANGIIAGIPLYCSQGMVAYALMCMDTPELININSIISTAQIWEAEGLIDPMSNIKNQYMHLWSGTADTVVYQGVMIKVAEMFEYMGATSITSIFNYSSEHAWITNRYGNSCSYLGEPYVNNCGYDFSGEYLSRAWNSMASAGKKNLAPFQAQGTMNGANFFQFDQTKYGASASSNSLASIGYLYVPTQCGTVTQSGTNTVISGGSVQCHIHLNFHGCTQQADLIGKQYITQTNLNEYAETNNFIVVYPQSSTNLENPKGCFAWWDFSGFDSNFANKDGAQMSMFNEMMQNLMTNGQI